MALTRRVQQQRKRVIAWSILGVLLFLAGVAYAEQLVPAVETERYDENALEKLASLALIESQPKINSSPVCLLSLTTSNHLYDTLIRFNPLRQTPEFTLKPPSLDLYKRLSTYRI